MSLSVRTVPMKPSHAIPLAALSLALSVVSCASLGDPFLLALDVDGKYQAEALVSAGKDAYRERLVAQGDVAASIEVQRYFEAALRYDPTNAEAARYLAIVEDYRANRFADSMKRAEALLDKPKRSADEEYAMLLAIRRANSIYPSDASAMKLLATTGDARKAYVAARLEEAEALKAGLKPDAKDAERERVYIAAFTLVSRTRDVEPKDVKGNYAYRELRADIAAIVKKRLDGMSAMASRGAFEEAKGVLTLVKDLDKKIGHEFSDDIKNAEYELYLSWAKYHEGRREWARADARVRTALAVQKGSEAVALQKRIAAAVDAEERGASFDAGLKNLDAYIAKKELVKAQRLLASLSKTASDDAQRRALDRRRKTLLDALPPLYQSGVKAYREERFKDAVAAFEVVVAVGGSYEDAVDYLEKSRAKQKLLDQY